MEVQQLGFKSASLWDYGIVGGSLTTMQQCYPSAEALITLFCELFEMPLYILYSYYGVPIFMTELVSYSLIDIHLTLKVNSGIELLLEFYPSFLQAEKQR